MSVDLFVYSENSVPVERAALAQALQRKGWHVLFLECAGNKECVKGALSNDAVYGTQKATVLKTLRELLAKGAEKKLEELFENEGVGATVVVVEAPFNAREHFGEDPDDPYGSPEIVAHMRKAKSHYTVTTSAGRNERSCELQIAVWKCLGELAGGLLEDPQTGEAILFGPQGEQVLAEIDDSEGTAIGDLKKYFQAAKDAGFPVEAKKDDVSLNTVTLSQAELERLLKFTRDHFPKEDPSGSAMATMILEDYQRKKGKPFAREYGPWFAQMQEKYGQFSF